MKSVRSYLLFCSTGRSRGVWKTQQLYGLLNVLRRSGLPHRASFSGWVTHAMENLFHVHTAAYTRGCSFDLLHRGQGEACTHVSVFSCVFLPIYSWKKEEERKGRGKSLISYLWTYIFGWVLQHIFPWGPEYLPVPPKCVCVCLWMHTL